MVKCKHMLIHQGRLEAILNHICKILQLITKKKFNAIKDFFTRGVKKPIASLFSIKTLKF